MSIYIYIYIYICGYTHTHTHTHSHTNTGPTAQDAELVPHPGFKPTSPEMEAQSPNHWTTREIPMSTF